MNFLTAHRFVLCLCAALLISTAPAVAQQVAEDGKVVIPWGDLLYSSASLLVTLAGSVLAFALARLPASILTVIKTWQVDQLLQRSIGYGINMVAGAAKGQALSMPVANKVAEAALEYAVTNGSAALVAWMGGKPVVAQKIIARLDLAPNAVVKLDQVASQ